MKKHALLSLLLSIGMLVPPAFAQSFYGSIVGTITDQSGGAEPGVKVTLTSTATGLSLTAESDRSGNYEFLNLVPGIYQLDFEATGFKHLRRLDIQVQVAGTTRVDALLQVGAVTQTVEVTTQAPLIQTDSSSVSQTVEGRSVLDMPLNGRNTMNLVALVPGVTPGGLFLGSPVLNTGSSTNDQGYLNFQAAGGQPNTGGALIDGAPLIIEHYHSVALLPTQDAIQEFRVEMNNVPPEYGQAADGVIIFTTKSGSNAFHGSVYEYLRNASFNANNFFSKRQGLPTQKYTQNQFGATLAGPFVKDKMFFFVGYEGYRLATAITTTYTVPTAAERAGDFSNYRSSNGQLIVIYNPYTSPRVQFTGNVIPPEMLNPTALAFEKYWALPNGPGTGPAATNNYTVNAPTGGSQEQYNNRVDFNLSAKQRLFARFTDWEIDTGRLDPMNVGAGSTGHQATQNAVVGDTYTLSPTTILDTRASYTRFFDGSHPNLLGVDYTTLGWPAFYNSQIGIRLPPSMSPSGFTASGGGGTLLRAVAEIDSLSGGITKILGKHTVKFGGEYRRMPASWGEGGGGTNGVFTFTNNFTASNPASPGNTGAGLASFLLGLGSTGSITNYNFVAQEETYAGAYVGDTFQATSKLTLTLGVRWEFPGYFTERHNRASVFLTQAVNPAVQKLGLSYPGDDVPVASSAYSSRYLTAPHYDLFEPRVGLAYRATPKIVIRSGFGITHMGNDIFRDMMPVASPVNLAPTAWITTLDGSQTPKNTLSNPWPNGLNQTLGGSSVSTVEGALLGRQLAAILPNQPAGYVMQWNLGVEHQLGNAAMAGVSYVAAKGVHLYGGYSFSGIVGTSLNQLPDKYLSLGSALVQQVPNPFYGTVATGVLSTPTIPYGQLLTPYPQYAGVYSPNLAAFDSNYQSLQAKFQRRFGAGGNFLASYTWAKNIGTTDNTTSYVEGSGYPFGQIQDFNNIAGSRSELSYDVPQRFVGSYVVDLPFGKGKKFLGGVSGPLDKLISGWGVTGISTFQSGYPLPLSAQPNVVTTQFYGGVTRPNVVAGCNKPISGAAESRLNGWFNISCFTQPSSFAWGNESRTDSQIRAAGVNNWDASLGKSTPIVEQANLQFRAEVFNIANRVMFSAPGTVFGTSQFGVVSGQRNQPRLIQLSLRLNF